jgi:hypothetical protein
MYVIIARTPDKMPMVLCEHVHQSPEWVRGPGALREALRFIHLETARQRVDAEDLGLVCNIVREDDVSTMYPELEMV